MWVKNKSKLPAVVARARIARDLAVVAVTIESVLDLEGGVWSRSLDEAPRGDNDPPDIRRIALWRGVSLTAFGHVRGPARPPYVQAVRLRCDELVHDLVVTGDRVWRRHPSGDLLPSEPAPFDAMDLTWSRAFGGSAIIAPGPFPGSRLPHPGGTVAHAQNPGGRGWAPAAATAEGVLLPNIEDPRAQLRRFGDEPRPVGLAPCAELPMLRASHSVMEAAYGDGLGASEAAPLMALEQALRMQHHASGSLILPEVSVGAAVVLEGVGASPLRLSVPSSPLSVSIGGRALAGRVRSVHVDADRQRARVVHGHAMTYDPQRAPRWIAVTPAEAA